LESVTLLKMLLDVDVPPTLGCTDYGRDYCVGTSTVKKGEGGWKKDGEVD